MFLQNILSDNLLFGAFLILLACFIIQMAYYWGIFSKLAFYNKKIVPEKNYPVSVVICAKNEYSNLKKNLPLILEQEYANFEVVLVNDCSDDDSHYLLKNMSEQYPHLSVVTIKQNVNFFSGKKFALAVGIKSAKHDLVLLTDADCTPKSKRWIFEMQKNFSDKNQIILGYSGYEKRKGFLNQLIRFDTIYTAIQYLSWSLSGMTYMGVGRNLAYNKELFFKNKGFTSHYQIPSGDDDLLINQIAKNNNACIEISHESQTFSAPKTSYSDWFRQKKRHYSTSNLYKLKHKIMLGLFPFSNLLFYATLVFMMVFFIKASFYNDIIFIGSLYVLKTASMMFIFKKCMNRLDEKNLLLISPVMDIIFLVINPLIAFSNYLVHENKWK
ncbi:MAG TPA: glycosyltransferase [Bacteroidales bacterium]|nr:glycosyltransferase [Bacteroidales bacterium]HPS16075.1 glycosyltransferase [Bacteroidales bacterium]